MHKKRKRRIQTAMKRKRTRIIGKVSGGIITFLIPTFAALSALGSLARGAAAVTQAVKSSQNMERQFNEASRHNRTMEAIAIGKGMYLKPYRNGLGLINDKEKIIIIIKQKKLNDSLKHTIYEFFPKVVSGYRIIESPVIPIYLPVNVQTLDHIQCTIVDQNDKLIDFRGEEIILRLHLKKENYNYGD